MPVRFITTPAANHQTGKIRTDGWLPDLRAAFLLELAESGSVTDAVETVAMSLSGLYALRQRDAVFEAAWDAARLLTRERLRDTLIERAFDGEVHISRKEGNETVRRRRNYRLSLGMLDRLEQQKFSKLARLFAGDFETVVSLIDCDADGLRWRTWLNGFDHDFCPVTLRQLFPLAEETAENAPEFAIWEYGEGRWRTDLPPPMDFVGQQCGDFGDEGYDRDLSAEEEGIHRDRLEAERGDEEVEPGKLERGREAWSVYFEHQDDAELDVPSDDDDARADDLEDALGPIEVKSMDGLPRRGSEPHAVMPTRAMRRHFKHLLGQAGNASLARELQN